VIRLVVSDETVNPHDTSFRHTFMSSSAVTTDVSSADVMSRGYLASSSGDTSGTQSVVKFLFFVACEILKGDCSATRHLNVKELLL